MATTTHIFAIVLLALVCSAQAKITVYEHSNYNGESRTYYGTNPNIGSIFNDKTTSYRVTNGETWVLYDDSSYKGRRHIARGNNPNVGDRFNDRMTSLEKL